MAQQPPKKPGGKMIMVPEKLTKFANAMKAMAGKKK